MHWIFNTLQGSNMFTHAPKKVSLSVALVMGLAGCGDIGMSDQDYVARAKEYQDKRELRSAVIDLKSALEKNDRNAEARLLLGRIYLEVENGAAAEKELRRAMELSIPVSELGPDIAQALLLQGKNDEVIQLAENNASLAPAAQARMLAWRAKAELSRGQISESEQSARAALELDPKEVESRLALARIAIVQNRGEEAVKFIDEALRLNPRYVEAWALKGDLHALRGRTADALGFYAKAIELNPQSVRARLGRANAALRANDVDLAKKDVKAVLATVKDHGTATFLSGVVAVKEGRYEDALATFQKVQGGMPEQRETPYWLALAHAALGQYNQAEQFAQNYVGAFPQSPAAHRLVAYVNLRQRDPKGAIAALQPLTSASSPDQHALQLMGMAHAASGDIAKGADYFQRAVAAGPGNAAARAQYSLALLEQDQTEAAMDQIRRAMEASPELSEAELVFVRQLIAKKEVAEATRLLGELEAKHPRDPRIANLRGGLMLSQAKIPEAKAAFATALKMEPGFPPAAHNLALLALRNGDAAGARAQYQSVLKVHSDHTPTLMAMYHLERQQGREEEALKQLEAAYRRSADDALIATALAREYLTRGAESKAVQATDAAFAAHPEDPGLLEVRGLALLQTGQPEKALQMFNNLVRLRPDAADGYFYQSQSYAALGRQNETRKALMKATELNPAHFKANAALARLELGAGNTEKAGQLASRLRKNYPKNAEGALIEYEVLMQQKRYEQAIQVIQQAVGEGPQTGANVLRLARAEWSAGKRQAAVDRASAWVKLNPKDLEAKQFIAQAREAMGQLPGAIAMYEQILKEAPGHVGVLNNLAWLLRASDPKRALSLAEDAYKRANAAPAVANTYGMVLLANGDTSRAVTVLGDAAKARSGDAQAQYHYALALARSGSKEKAKAVLAPVMDSSATFAERGEAQRLWAELGGSRR